MHCPLSYCCTIFISHDARTPTDGQVLGRHLRQVNPPGISLRVAMYPPLLRGETEARFPRFQFTSGGGRVNLHLGYLRIPATLHLVGHAILLTTFAFSGYARSVEARILPLRSKGNRNPSRSNRKNRKLHQISNPKTKADTFLIRKFWNLLTLL